MQAFTLLSTARSILVTDERRRTGSHYTPRSLTEPIVRYALEPAFERLGPDATPVRASLVATNPTESMDTLYSPGVFDISIISLTATDKPTYPCPCCGGHMNIIETFKCGATPQYRPPPPTAIRIDTS